MEKGNKIQIKYKDTLVTIEPHSISGQTIFRVLFPDKRKPLVITRPLNANASRFWTSIPEGRQKEAEEIGLLIAAYLQKK